MTLEDKMKNALEIAQSNVTIAGDVIIVSRLKPREVKTAGGLVMASSMLTGHKQVTGFDSNQPEFVRVIAVGKGYYDDETKSDIALDLKPGNIIEVGKNSVVWFSSFGSIMNDVTAGTGVGLTRENEYRLKFETEEVFIKFMEAFER